MMGTLRKEVVVGVTCWELKTHIFKVLELPTSTHGTKTWEGDIRNSHGKVVAKGKIYVMCHVKMRSLTTHHIILAEFNELPMELHAL